MISINYPKDYERYYFEMEYLNQLDILKLERNFNKLKKVYPVLIHISIKKILLSDIKELFNLSEFINSLITLERIKSTYIPKKSQFEEKLKEVFNYDDKKIGATYQNNIKQFFEQNVPMKTCYYCNLDFINSFNDTYDYHDALDFVKKASIDELCKIKDVTKPLAKKIYSQKTIINSIDDLTNPSVLQKSNLKDVILKEKHSHFTLDHVIDKGTHPLLSLSLYNFVPSCYACNSKFKGTKQFINRNTVNYLSPTLDEKDFKFDEDVKFRILFKNNNHISYIKSKKDFILDFKYFKNQAEYEKYIDIFKLKGRYIFHKDEIVELIEKKKKYSDSKIEEMSKQLKIPIQKIKEDIFGKELFQGNLEDKSMTKFKRDIARQIGIIK